MTESIFVDKLFANKYNRTQQIGNTTTFAPKSNKTEKKIEVCIIGVGSAVDENSFYNVRKNFYDLYFDGKALPILDCGNINFDAEAIKNCIEENENSKIIFLCSTAEISAKILAIQQNVKTKIAMVLPDITLNNSHISAIEKTSAKNISVIGFQKYLSENKAVEQLTKNNCEMLRLGEFRADNNEAEPILRDSHILAIDTNAVRQSDGGSMVLPNGLYAEELCTIANYAGLSNNIWQACIACENDNNQVSANLVAQTIWHMVDGFSKRIVELPEKMNKNNIHRYDIIDTDNKKLNMTFCKSSNTNRWWIEVLDNGKKRYFACTQKDYQTASQKGIPLRWLQAMQKIR